MRGRREEELASHSSSENGLGMTIRAWRRFHGMTVTELALQAGFGTNGRGYISRIEHGHIRHLGEDRLKRIAAVLQLQSMDLLLHRMPEAQEETPIHDLDEAIIGGKALIKGCSELSFDWARIQLLLAKLYHEQATALQTMAAKYTVLTHAQLCIERCLLVFTEDATPRSFLEATHLGREIADLLDATIIAGCQAFLKRCPPRSIDWARIQLLRAKFYCERATTLQGLTARASLTEAQHCIKAALPIFTERRVQRSLKEAKLLDQEITLTLQQLGEL